MELGIIKVFENVLTLLSSPEPLLLFTCFIPIGIVVGALPGLTATMGVAVLTGMTYSISTGHTLVMLMSVYIGAVYGGSLSAILINIPGTGAAAATVLDGYPLARKGEAGPTIGLAATSSAIGTIIGVIALASFTPLIAKLSLNFTSPEFFMLAIFGITISGTITSPDIPLKGWMMGLMGIMVSFIGLDKIYGFPRFTYGSPNLLGGISFIPSMIGLFGITQIVSLLKEKQEIVISAEVKRIIPKIGTIFKNWLLIIRSGIIGVCVGAIPGAGEDIAAFVSYDMAKKTHPKGPLFGTGVKEAVIAAETANNACIGGSIIPLLTLGIPGSPPSAVLLGALLLHNINPGPMLSIEKPFFIFEISAIILLGGIFLAIFALVLAKPVSKILKIPPPIFMPIVAVLCTIGSYALNLNSFDLLIMLVFGIFGYFLSEMGYPPAPFVLGIILGPLADENLRRTLVISDGSILLFFTRPIAFILLLAIVITVLNQSRPFKKKIRMIKGKFWFRSKYSDANKGYSKTESKTDNND